MTEQRRLSLSYIVFNNNLKIDLDPNSIVVFVGPNNSGKSQALRDMYNYLHTPKPGIVINHCYFNPLDATIIKNMLEKYHKDNKYNGNGFNFFDSTINGHTTSERGLSEMRNAFVSFMDTKNRLNSIDPIECLDHGDPITQSMHLVAYNKEHSEKLSVHFKNTFNTDIEPYIGGRHLVFSVGNMPVIDENDPKEIKNLYEKYLREMPKLHNQGDGMKSFSSIIINSMDELNSIIMIDEPESFLHPPQAKEMGMYLGRNIEEKQLFITTHSIDIINGLIETAHNRLKIIRITRTENNNDFSILNNEEVADLHNNYALAYTNVLDGIFHNKVVLCESESDCKFYSWILSKIYKGRGEYSDILFIGVGGISGFKSISDALKSLSVDVVIIADLDFMTDSDKLIELIDNTHSNNKDEIKAYCKLLLKHIAPNGGERNISKKDITSILESNSNEYLNSDEIAKIKEMFKFSINKKIKQDGIRLFKDDPTIFDIYLKLDSLLKIHGIVLVPVGELESFVPEEKSNTKHGFTWIRAVLGKYTDEHDPVYSEVTDFVEKNIAER
jgi:Predicted ATP-dependent endonuclease of the OLD family